MNASATRRELHFHSNDDIVREIQRLRLGYTKTGNWSLAQICWHLNKVLTVMSKPLPHPEAPPTSEEARTALQQILATGKIPFPVQAPEPALPPQTCGEQDIDAFIATLNRLNGFSGPYHPHRIFGKLTNDQGHQLSMIHCAHHFSFLVPAAQKVAHTVEG